MLQSILLNMRAE